MSAAPEIDEREKRKLEVFVFHGGVQSVAIAALIIEGALAQAALRCGLRHGRERASTWSYLEQYVAPGLASVGLHVERIDRRRFAFKYDDLWKAGELAIPAFVDRGTGEPERLPASCAARWKTEPMGNWFARVPTLGLRHWRKWFGFCLDDADRALAMMERKEWRKGLLRFPLIHDFRTDRKGALSIVEAHGWPAPPVSGCWLCPLQSDAEWQDLKMNQPVDWQRAVDQERQLRKVDPSIWLHRSCKPLEEVSFSPSAECRRPCAAGSCLLMNTNNETTHQSHTIGWQCPCCHRVNAPWVSSCGCINADKAPLSSFMQSMRQIALSTRATLERHGATLREALLKKGMPK